ncbi:MAG: hypothetical protein EXR79_06980 [Myxococcales bacterium]|nr:hypothetical protein [Myxococcales bacterium]
MTRPSSLATLTALTLLAAACGEDAKPAPTADATAGTGDLAATPKDGAGDAATAVADSATADVLVKPKEVAAPSKACPEVLACAGACADGDAKCTAACAADGADAAKADFKAYTDCAVQLCADATDTTSRRACIWTKCFDKLAKCGELGQGELNCAATAGCAARCTLGDVGCALKCGRLAAKDGVTAWKDLAACGEGKCGKELDGAKRAACMAANCKTELDVCKGAGWDCVGTSACLARCPTPLPTKPNACAPICALFATPAGLTVQEGYAKCKTQCAGSRDLNCPKQKCGAQQAACFPDSGNDLCPAVYNCIKKDCQGLGGKASCIVNCWKAATGAAKDAFLHFEGCMTSALESTIAANQGCEFPYDEQTCISQVKGLCNSEAAFCFKAQ